jgi:hypothetical protein
MKHLIKVLVVLAIGAGSVILFLPAINASVAEINTDNGYNSAVVSMAGVLPIVYITFSILMIFVVIYGGQKVVEYIRYKRWDDFGNRLKLAYAAKFGGENLAFNQEIDSRILQCKTMKKGMNADTKGAAERWLKQYAHMCEIPYVIPEEEHLSEVEKTKEFADTFDKEQLNK